jgi:hypothetical protein
MAASVTWDHESRILADLQRDARIPRSSPLRKIRGDPRQSAIRDRF